MNESLKPPFTLRQALRLAGYLAAFLAAAWAGDRLLGSAAHAALLASRNRFSVMYSGKARAEVLIMGNSRSVNGFHAPSMERRLGKTCFHLGYNGVSASVAECLLADYLERNPAPRLVLFEATLIQGGLSVADKLNAFRGESPRMGALVDSGWPEMALPSRLSLLYRHNSDFWLRSFYYLLHDDQGWINRGLLTPRGREGLRRMPQVEMDAPPDNLGALARLLNHCRARGIVARAVMAPMHPIARGKRVNIETWMPRASDVFLENGAEFFDFSSAFDGRDECFADGLHLNERGNRELLPLMEEAGAFRD
jgi:hypothetical protein